MDLGVEHREQWRKGARLVVLFYSFNSFGLFVFRLFLRSSMQFPDKSLMKGLIPSYNCLASLWRLDQSHLGMKGLSFLLYFEFHHWRKIVQELKQCRNVEAGVAYYLKPQGHMWPTQNDSSITHASPVKKMSYI